MELRHLEHFVAVADDGQFTRAAARLHIVQSGLSASIRALERELGTALFVRTTQRVRLTEAGLALLPEARRALAAAQTARASVAGINGPVAGPVAIGVTRFPPVLDLPALLGKFHAAHPEVEIRLCHGAPRAIVELVRTGELDLAFTSLPGQAPRAVEYRPLVSEQLVLVVPPNHPLSRAKSVDIKTLADEAFADFPTGWGPRLVIDEIFAAAGIERRVALEVNDTESMAQLVRNGLGIGFLPTRIAGGAPDLAAVSVRRCAPVVHHSVVYPLHGPNGAAGRALLQLIGAGPATTRRQGVG